MNKLVRITLLINCAIFGNQAIAASETTGTQDYQGSSWINFGLGVPLIVTDELSKIDGIPPVIPGIGIELSYNYMVRNNQFLTIDGGATNHFFVDVTTNAAVLYGLIRKREKGYISGSVGAGVSGHLVFSGMSSVGIGPVTQVQAFWTQTDKFGLGFIGTVGYYPSVNVPGDYHILMRPSVGFQYRLS